MSEEEYWQQASLNAIIAVHGTASKGESSISSDISEIAALTADKLMNQYRKRFPVKAEEPL